MRGAAALLFLLAAGTAVSADPRGELGKAMELRVRRQHEEALKILRKVASDPAADADTRSEALLQSGLVLEEKGRRAEALAAYDAILKDFPGRSPAGHAALGRGRVMARLGRWEEAAAAFQDVLRLYPRQGAAALIEMGDMEGERGRLHESAQAYRSAMRNFPLSPEAHLARGFLDGVCEKALVAAGSVTAWSDTLARAECRMDAGKYDEARKLLEASLARCPPPEWKVELLIGLGRCETACGKYGAAEGAFRRAAKAAGPGPAAAAARMAIVQGMIDRNRIREAIRELEGIRKDFPGTAEALHADLMAGACQELMRDNAKAEASYRRVMDSAPSTPQAMEAQQNLMRLMEARR